MRYLILSVLLISCLIAMGQEDYVEGYIIKNTGDSLRGYLKKDVDNKLSIGIYFKRNMEDVNSELLTTNEISGFAFENGNIYKSITYYNPLEKEQKKEFAKFLVEGHHSLYSIPRNESYRFYLTSITDTGYFLFDNVYGTAGVLERRGNFRDILNYMSRNCDAIKHRLVNVAFTEPMMIDFVKDLNACSGDEKTVVHYRRNKSEIHYLLYAGAMPYKKNNTYTFQGQMRIMYPGISRKASFVTGVAYSRVSEYLYSYVERDYSNFITQVISIPICFQYNFTQTKFQPLIYVGLSAAYADLDYPDPIVKKGFQKNFGIALVAGVGLEYYPLERLAIKADWRYELLMHAPTIGIGYRIK